MRQITFTQLRDARNRVRQDLAGAGTRRALCIAGVTVLLVLCIWLPYLTMGRHIAQTDGDGQAQEASAPVTLSLADRAAAFSDFLAAETEPEPLEASLVSYTQRRQSKVLTDWALDTFTVDRQTGELGGSATLYYDIPCAGGSFRVMHAYREWFGDWNNWLSLYADADTGEIYYLYVSCGCQKNAAQYGDEEMDNAALAGLLAERSGFTLEAVEDTGEQTGVCFVTGETGAAVFDLKCLCYPASLIDYTWVIRP